MKAHISIPLIQNTVKVQERTTLPRIQIGTPSGNQTLLIKEVKYQDFLYQSTLIMISIIINRKLYISSHILYS